MAIAVTAANSLLGPNYNSTIQLAYSDCYGTLNSQGYNFISNTGAKEHCLRSCRMTRQTRKCDAGICCLPKMIVRPGEGCD